VRTADTDDGEKRGGARLLVIAWLILFAALAGVGGWLYISGEQGGGAVAGIPRIVAPLPPSPQAPPPVTAAEGAPPEQGQTQGPPEAEPTPPAQAASQAPIPPESPPEAAPTETAAPPETAVPQAPPEAKPAEAKPAEAKPEETKAAESKPAEAKPAEAKPEETKAAETKPAEAKPAEAKPEETKLAKPAEIKPVPPKAPPVHETETAEKPAAKPAEHAAEKPPPEKPPEVEKEATAESAPPAETQIAALPAEAKPHAPDPALIEHGRQGPLPVIGPHGREPWQVYARPFDQSDKRPRIAIVITDLGLSGAATETAIQQLPGAVTLSFSPYAKGLDQWTNLARAAGHEVLLDLPMEPMDYPNQDPGPYTLLTSLDPRQNLFKMQWLLSRATGYVGVTNHMGSRFTTSGPDLKPVLEAIKDRGLLFLDSRSSDQSVAAKMAEQIGMAWAYNNRFIDAVASRDAIDAQLAAVEKIAKKSGYAIAMGSAYPVTMERVADWIPKAESRGFAIAPVSAIADKQAVK